MRRIVFVFNFIFLFTNTLFSQLKDTVYGKVMSVKEEIVFLDKNKQNYRIFNTDGDYGHSGFISNEATKDRFYSNWYHSSFVHYLNYYKEFNIKGKAINEIWYYKNGDTLSRYEYTYNKKDKLIQIKEFDRFDQNEFIVINYKFDDYSDLLKSKLRYYSNDPNYYSLEYFMYDDDKRLIETNFINSDAIKSGDKFEYDDLGRKLKKIRKDYYKYNYFENGSSSYGPVNFSNDKLSELYIYDYKNQLVEILHYYNIPKNENEVYLNGKTKNYYDENGLLLRKITTNEKDTLNSLIEYKYDKRNRLIEENYIHQRFIENKEDIIFDKKIINIKEIKLPKFELIVGRRLKYKYDEEYIIELIETNTFDKPITNKCSFEYKFDNKSNWIEQSKYINGKKLYVWKRKIIYHE
jgi:hypothetical protein